jgi:hydroxymethylbilane synthase
LVINKLPVAADGKLRSKTSNFESQAIYLPVPLRLGTRASALAQWQANWVAEHLRSGGHEVEMVLITTQGDRTQGESPGAAFQPIGASGPFGAFTKELQLALLDGRIDLAVHSLKDLPTDFNEGLTVTAVPERASPFDVLLSRHSEPLDRLPDGALVGTGSLRRRAQLLHYRPDLRMADIRGNVDTRLTKLRDGRFDALILAEAGLSRLGLAEQITQVLPPDIMLPAVGQGALGIETRTDDMASRSAVAMLDHPDSRTAAFTERALLAKLAGGCLAPIGAYCQKLPDGQLRLSACVLSPDGSKCLHANRTAAPEAWAELASTIATDLLDQGAARLIEQARSAS